MWKMVSLPNINKIKIKTKIIHELFLETFFPNQYDFGL